MGSAGRLRGFLNRLTESDEQRLAEEIQRWADTVPGTARISDTAVRDRAKVAGVVKRITVRPMEGSESLEALVSDGTGEVRVVWMGRRTIPGLKLGTRIVVEGMVAEKHGERRMVNPTFDFAT
ncbi:MAG: OB-fold nucleic acid binding domain-containing protein [Candidatus Velamenicoccus archaeovorus]